MTEKVDSGQLLSERDHAQLCDAYKCLHLIENNAIQSSKVRARCMEVNDLHANSKCFFDFLRAKRANSSISSLEFNGQILQDGNSIAQACTEHFEKLFAASFSTSDAWFTAIQEFLAYMPQIIDSRTADNCEKSITEDEVFMALQSLKNGKAPGLDGLAKEFVMAFSSSLKTLILEACNEIWSSQKMPFSFKQGKIKLIPKINGRLFAPFVIERSMHQGCPLSPLFYALASTPMFYLLEAKLNSNLIHGISVFGNSHVAVRFADDTFIFAKAEVENVQNILACLDPFSEASSLCINMRKSVLINIYARNFESLPWYGPKVDRGTVFWHLGYPLGINVPIKDKICWVLSFMQPYLMYYLLLLDWKKRHLQGFDRLIKDFLSNKKHNRALVLSAWRYVCQPKPRGGLGILHLHAHIMAQRTAFIMRITSSFKPLWTKIFWQLMENAVNLCSGIGLSIQVDSNFPFLHEYQVPLSIDFSDPWRDWLLAKHTRWWIGKANTFYLSLLSSNDITLQCNARWRLEKAPSWWHARFSLLWESSLIQDENIHVEDFHRSFHFGSFSLQTWVARCSMSPLGNSALGLVCSYIIWGGGIREIFFPPRPLVSILIRYVLQRLLQILFLIVFIVVEEKGSNS
ncbi:hypothetical protein KP509_01G062200 [Ceratopteris richardii]|uniref:Reverse transcriptase domain-containing protein n=1 Tax=Ceratopteris richardii TaxID=49495 RepID=A0A8T2VKB3_CERRI|nr:hypothetical protein KP509_01G062200 [Ceratopteris richardii]